jgi:hypothetical protein
LGCAGLRRARLGELCLSESGELGDGVLGDADNQDVAGGLDEVETYVAIELETAHEFAEVGACQ